MAPIPTPPRPNLTLQIPQTPLLSSNSSPNTPISPIVSPPSPFPSSNTTPTAPTSSTAPTPIFPPLPRPKPCLQCHTLGLKCSFITLAHILPSRVSRHRALEASDENACVRCKRNGVEFCILQKVMAEPRTEWEEAREGEYRAEGVEGEVLRERVEELVEGKDGKVKLALPVVAEHHKKILRAVKWRWEGKEEEEEVVDLEGLKERERALEVILSRGEELR